MGERLLAPSSFEFGKAHLHTHRMPPSTSRARQLRNNPTHAEQHLWRSLRNSQIHGQKFTRQFPVGPYIVDFCCRELRLVVEVDGGGHASSQRHDQTRDWYLESLDYVVLRFWNTDVMVNLEGVLEVIAEALKRQAAVRSRTTRKKPTL